jgi:hypothetical protein
MLTEIIGSDAGLIWRLLSERKRLTIRDFVSLTGYREMYIYLPLGWLARENKIIFSQSAEDMFVELL